MKKIKADVNFSDRSPKRIDPHQWEEVEALVSVRGRVVHRAPAYVCMRCGLWTPLPPEMTHSIIIGETCRANALPDVRSDPARDAIDEGMRI